MEKRFGLNLGWNFGLKSLFKLIVYVSSDTTDTYDMHDTYDTYNCIVRFIYTYDTYQQYNTFFKRYDTDNYGCPTK